MSVAEHVCFGECDLQPRRIDALNAYAIGCARCGMTGPIALNLTDDDEDTIGRAWVHYWKALLRKLNRGIL